MLRTILFTLGLIAVGSASVMACLFSMTFSGSIERGITDGMAFMSLTLAMLTGFMSVLGEGESAPSPAWKRALSVMSGLLMAAVSIGLIQFATSYSGSIEDLIVNIAAGLALMFGLGAGISVGAGLLGSPVSLPATEEARFYPTPAPVAERLAKEPQALALSPADAA